MHPMVASLGRPLGAQHCSARAPVVSLANQVVAQLPHCHTKGRPGDGEADNGAPDLGGGNLGQIDVEHKLVEAFANPVAANQRSGAGIRGHRGVYGAPPAGGAGRGGAGQGGAAQGAQAAANVEDGSGLGGDLDDSPNDVEEAAKYDGAGSAKTANNETWRRRQWWVKGGRGRVLSAVLAGLWGQAWTRP